MTTPPEHAVMDESEGKSDSVPRLKGKLMVEYEKTLSSNSCGKNLNLGQNGNIGKACKKRKMSPTYQGKCLQRNHSLFFALAGTCSPLSAPWLRVVTVTTHSTDVVRGQMTHDTGVFLRCWTSLLSLGTLKHYRRVQLEHQTISSTLPEG